MSRRTLVRVGVAVALLLGGLTTIGGCSNTHEPADAQSHSMNQAAKSSPTTMPADGSGAAGTPGVSLEGVPQPPASPSPESLAAKKVCPNCGFANDPDAKMCAKCGHKLD